MQIKRRAVWQTDTAVRQKPVQSIYRVDEFVIILNTETANSPQREISSTRYTILHPKNTLSTVFIFEGNQISHQSFVYLMTLPLPLTLCLLMVDMVTE